MDEALRTMRNHAALATVLVALLATPVFADDGVHVVVSGSIDRDAVRTGLEKELGRSVDFADACAAPCVDVRVDNNKATVIFAPRHGAPRERTVELGTDAAQWPLVVTLLAGNLVRDEASDVLAQLPAPGPEAQAEATPPPDLDVTPPDAPPEPGEVVAPPPPPAPTPQPEEHREWMTFGFGFVPGLSTDFTHVGTVKHFLSLDIIAGVSGGSSGVTIAGVVDIERGTVDGVQIAGVSAHARKIAGVQVGGVAALSGDVDGAQVGGVVAYGRRGGTQVAGVVAVSRGAAHVQVAGVSANAGAADVQVGGVSAVAKHAGNIQVAGVTSIAGSASVQVAGVVNVAHRVSGLQIAPINVARRIDGVQVGVINIGSTEGASFGLINIVPGGRYDVEAAIDSGKIGTALFRHGGNGWHNVYGIGGHPVQSDGPNDDVWMYGFGFGPSWKLDSSRIDLEAIGWQVNHGPRHSSDISILAQARLSLAYGIGPFAVVVGGAYNVYISNDQMSPLFLERRTDSSSTTREVTVERWPTAFVGIRM